MLLVTEENLNRKIIVMTERGHTSGILRYGHPYPLTPNPLNFGMWGAIDTKVGQTQYANVDTLVPALNQEWAIMSEGFLQELAILFSLICRRVWL